MIQGHRDLGQHVVWICWNRNLGFRSVRSAKLTERGKTGYTAKTEAESGGLLINEPLLGTRETRV